MTEIPTEKGPEPLDGSQSEEDLQSAKDLIAFFLIAMKNYALYPEDNEVSQRSVADVATRLSEFLKSHGNFRFHVKRDRLLFQGEVLYQAPPQTTSMAFLLFRDGVRWLEFQEGVELEEIAGFFKLLNQYREPHDESEGDLVTALWEAQFPHLRYEASDMFLEEEIPADFSLLQVTDKEHRGVEQGEEQEISPAISDPSMDGRLWKLEPEEIRDLREMVLEDEDHDTMEDMLDVLIVILREHIEEDDLADILNFLQTEFRAALSRVEFGSALNLLENLHEIHQSSKADRPWAVPMLDHFFKVISSYQVLNVLNQVWPVLDILESQRRLLRQVLILLRPEAILALGPMSLDVASARIQRELMEVIRHLAAKDIGPLERLLNHSDENLVRKIVPVLKHLEGDRPSELLLTMVHNSPERVRKCALDTLMARDPQLLKELFSLIEDTSHSIRMLMLKHLGQERDEMAEDLLLDYLGQRKFQRKDDQHLLASYRALGHCGSTRSIPFLRSALLNQGWLPGLRRSTHRQGAAIALMALGLDEARQILEKASRSPFPGVRLAYKKAMEMHR